MPKSRIFTTPSRGDEHVRRLDVAVDDPARVRLGQPARRSGRDAHRLFDRQRPSRDPLLQRLAVVQRHRQIELSRLGLADLVQRADVGVLEPADGPRLQPEALRRRNRRCRDGAQKLERDGAPEPGVQRPVDHAHRPAADLLVHLVRADGLPHQRHRAWCGGGPRPVRNRRPAGPPHRGARARRAANPLRLEWWRRRRRLVEVDPSLGGGRAPARPRGSPRCAVQFIRPARG